MNYLFDYGEFLICFGPAFLIITPVGLLLLANSGPSKDAKSSDEQSEDKHGEK